MRVHIDPKRCQGHGRCYATAPEIFFPDELGDVGGDRFVGVGRRLSDGSEQSDRWALEFAAPNRLVALCDGVRCGGRLALFAGSALTWRVQARLTRDAKTSLEWLVGLQPSTQGRHKRRERWADSGETARAWQSS